MTTSPAPRPPAAAGSDSSSSPLSAPDRSGQALAFDGIRHTYESSNGEDVLALERIDLSIETGSFVTLVGPSGCGKSTLLQIAAGFLVPTEGAVSSFAAPIRRAGADRGVVFQQPTSLLPWLTVRRNVELGPKLRGVGRQQRRDRATAELERVGLTEFADRAVYELSGGMQQRTQIARVLANDSPIMLMDEPFGALDALTREHLQTELREIARNSGSTVLLITHSVEEAVALGTRVVVMSRRPGRVVFDEAHDFARSDLTLDQTRVLPEFVEACARVRAAIEA